MAEMWPFSQRTAALPSRPVRPLFSVLGLLPPTNAPMNFLHRSPPVALRQATPKSERESAGRDRTQSAGGGLSEDENRSPGVLSGVSKRPSHSLTEADSRPRGVG